MNSLRWARAGVEPAIQELLDDPILLKLLAYDRLTLRDVEAAIADAQLRLEARNHGASRRAA